MVSFPHTPALCSASALLAPLHALAAAGRGLEATVLGEFSVTDGRSHTLPCFRLMGPDAGHDPIRLGLFAGVHGDEPAGCASLVEFALALAADPARAAGYELWFYPVVNPTGYERGTRENHSGKDLNREFWRSSTEAEVRLFEAELRARQFHGLITLHADDTCEGLYGYTHGRTLDEMLLKPALHAASGVLPLDRREKIDGFAARDGLICECFHGVLAPPPEQKPQPFNLIFETPAHAPFAQQVEAGVAALATIVAEYRGFIAHAQGI